MFLLNTKYHLDTSININKQELKNQTKLRTQTLNLN